MLNLGETIPNFPADTTIGPISFYDWLGNSWGLLFTHPVDFGSNCTTELGRVVALQNEFAKRNFKVISLSSIPLETLNRWLNEVNVGLGLLENGFPYPVISDKFGCLPPLLQLQDASQIRSDGRTPVAKVVFLIDPEKRLRCALSYPSETSRNFDEVLRIIDSILMSERNKGGSY